MFTTVSGFIVRFESEQNAAEALGEAMLDNNFVEKIKSQMSLNKAKRKNVCDGNEMHEQPIGCNRLQQIKIIFSAWVFQKCTLVVVTGWDEHAKAQVVLVVSTIIASREMGALRRLLQKTSTIEGNKLVPKARKKKEDENFYKFKQTVFSDLIPSYKWNESGTIESFKRN